MTLKVIACSYSGERHVRINAKYPDHNQDILSWEEHAEMFQLLIDMELSQDAGVSLDILIVCNGDCGGFFEKYDGKKTKNGTIFVRNRENIGGSFGAYSYAYQNFKYDNYFFTEDDMFIYGDKYAEKLLTLQEEKGIGFLAMVGIHEDGKFPTHVHGGVGLISRQALDLIAVNGELPYYHGEWKRMWVIIKGEIELSQALLCSGVSVGYFGEKRWDDRNFIMPYYNLKCILNQK